MPAAGLDAPINTSYFSRLLQTLVPHNRIFISEAVTNHARMTEQLQPSRPGASFTKGAGDLGWSNGAALGVKLATDCYHSQPSRESKPPSSSGKTSSAFVCSITGDGSFLFGIPSSVYWISAHHGIPFLAIVLWLGRSSAVGLDRQSRWPGTTCQECGAKSIFWGPTAQVWGRGGSGGERMGLEGESGSGGGLEGLLLEAIEAVLL